MNLRAIAVVAVALIATAAARAEAPKPAPVEPKPAREQTLLGDAANGMREILRAVTPEISLPRIEIKLPKLAAATR